MENQCEGSGEHYDMNDLGMLPHRELLKEVEGKRYTRSGCGEF